MKIYITGNANKTLAKEIERQLNAYLYNAHADECGDDKSSFNAVKDNLRGYTDAILLIDLLESCEQSTFTFKVGYIIGKLRKKNVNLYFLHATDKDVERSLCDLKFYCLKSTDNETDTAEEICFELFERWREDHINYKIKHNMLLKQEDETYIKALKYCVCSNQASVSAIQRRFPVGYIKACKIFDWMVEKKYVAVQSRGYPAKVLMTYEEFKNVYGDIDD